MVKGLAKSEPLCFTVLPGTRESCSASTAQSLLFQQLAVTPVGAFLLVCTWKLSNSSFRNVGVLRAWLRGEGERPAESVSQTGDQRNKLIFAHP